MSTRLNSLSLVQTDWLLAPGTSLNLNLLPFQWHFRSRSFRSLSRLTLFFFLPWFAGRDLLVVSFCAESTHIRGLLSKLTLLQTRFLILIFPSFVICFKVILGHLRSLILTVSFVDLLQGHNLTTCLYNFVWTPRSCPFAFLKRYVYNTLCLI